MIEPVLNPEYIDEIPIPDISHLITEDDTPVDNIYSGLQQYLLYDSMEASWEGPPGEDRNFIHLVNVGVFDTVTQQAIVPDVMVSLHVTFPEELWEKRHRSYFIWEYGKPPDLVIEIVSNRKGGELAEKRRRYARMGVAYYVVYDPQRLLSQQLLHVLERQRTSYVPLDEAWFPELGLGLQLWTGEYRGVTNEWLRWCDKDGNLLMTASELRAKEQERADREEKRAEQEQKRADEERQRVERLAAQLRALGIEPEL
ncbi:MAG: Uma2 family endonuclease [Anaerolineae bacterium]|nr:Uma2 family endonuclease [Anaerolineae bacterium]